MDDFPLTCTPDTELDEVRRMMLQRHARYLPVMDGKTLMGVISFYDVAKAVVESQDFENRMLKAYIRDWPVEEAADDAAAAVGAAKLGSTNAFEAAAQRWPSFVSDTPCPAAPSATSSASPTSAKATARRSAA